MIWKRRIRWRRQPGLVWMAVHGSYQGYVWRPAPVVRKAGRGFRVAQGRPGRLWCFEVVDFRTGRTVVRGHGCRSKHSATGLANAQLRYLAGGEKKGTTNDHE